MRRFFIVGLCVFCLAGLAEAQTTDLIISEYVEGSSNNKALEIFNGTADVINLSGYTIERYSNGSSTATSIPLDGIDLAPGEVHVLVNPSASAPLLAYASQLSADINFNGNDALVLMFGGTTVIDSFGQVGVDPGSYWTCSEGDTANHTLRRLTSVCTGDTVVDDVFDPCDEWTFAPLDTFSGLDIHIADCGVVGAENQSSWGTMKASFR